MIWSYRRTRLSEDNLRIRASDCPQHLSDVRNSTCLEAASADGMHCLFNTSHDGRPVRVAAFLPVLCLVFLRQN